MNILMIVFLASLLLGQIGGISPFPGVVIYIHDIVLSLLVLFSLKRVHRGSLFGAIALFILSGLLSLAANSTRFSLTTIGFGSLYLFRWVLYACLYMIVAGNSVNPRVWLKGLYGVGVGFAILGLLQFFLYPDLRNLMYLGWDPHYYRLFSTLLDPNFMGIILVCTLLLGFSLFRNNNRWIMAGQAVGVVSLFLTYSRSSFLALAAAIGVWGIIQKNRKVFAVLAVFSLLIVILPHGNTLSLLRPDSTLARVGNWQESITLIVKAPIFGYGFDTLRYLHEASGTFLSKSAAGLDSSILFILATTGIVGFAAYTNLFVAMLKAGRDKPFYVASLTALLVHSLFVNSMFYPWVMIWMWILAGAVTYDR